MGHTDRLAVADAGLPIPLTTRRVDLSVVSGLPGFREVLRPILAELVVEEALLAQEIVEENPEMHRAIVDLLGPVPVRYLPHAEFKKLLPETKAVIRTGECTPYSNVILCSGTDGVFNKGR
jgi:D-ribose pyranase